MFRFFNWLTVFITATALTVKKGHVSIIKVTIFEYLAPQAFRFSNACTGVWHHHQTKLLKAVSLVRKSLKSRMVLGYFADSATFFKPAKPVSKIPLIAFNADSSSWPAGIGGFSLYKR